MSPETQILIHDIDAKLSKTADSKNSEFLRKIADLFLNSAKMLSEEQVALFDDVMLRLIKNVEQAALVELSARLAPVSNAPPNVVAHLACEDRLAIAVPLLEFSPALTEQALAKAAATKGQKHLLLIAGRTGLGEAVTDILFERGNSEVALKTISNPDARVSELGFVKLISRAKNDKPLAVAIANRNDMPPELEPFLKLALALT